MKKRQMDVWVRDINHAMKCHKALSVNICWIKNQEDMDKTRRLGCISQRSSLSPAQGKVAQFKIMLKPSSLDKDEKWFKEESSCQD
jgi:hypothetical protein